MAVEYDMIDLLSDLLQSEQAGAFHFMTEADPYINRTEAEIRRPLLEMIRATIRREDSNACNSHAEARRRKAGRLIVSPNRNPPRLCASA